MELYILNNIETDNVVKSLMSGQPYKAMNDVIRFAETSGVTDNSVKEYVISLIANDENIVSSLAGAGKKIGDDLKTALTHDISVIFGDLITLCTESYKPSGNPIGFYEDYKDSIKTLTETDDIDAFTDLLIEHYHKFGTGVLAKYIAYKYEDGLIGIENTDGITFSALVGLEYQKEILIGNTLDFVEGKTANNVLLFGDRGTGKSSSVKALLNMFYEEGLRVVEMPKKHLCALPSLVNYLSDKPHKYIIFLDDLSFETSDPDYKALKVAMDGQLEARPKNVLIYATSNRRHLIKETWADREGGEVHKNDNMQETLSLSERFGISLVFSAPTQKEYLNIVSELLKHKNIAMNAEIERKAIVWQMNYSGRSGRCASQFVASYLAKKSEKSEQNK